MNAQLLTVLSHAAPAKSGIGALQTKAADAHGAGVGASFAELLGQQADALDPELLDMLAALGLDPQAQKELLAQLKDLGVDSDQLNKLLQQFKSTDDPKELLALLRQSQPANTDALLATKQDVKNAADFISSTLFIANESKAIRSAQAALASLHQDAAQSSRFSLDKDKKPDNRFDVRFDLNNSSAAEKKTANTFNLNNFQSALHAATDGAKTTVSNASSPLLSELSGLSAQSHTAQNNATLGANSFNPTYSAQITTPLSQTAQWGADFGRVMVQMSQQAGQNNQPGLQTAEIRLDPPELGPLRIMLSINEGVANAMIFAAHAQTRQTIELSIPQLQQQLAQSGLSLGEANVSDQHFFAQSEQQSEQNKGENSESFRLHGLDQAPETDALLTANTKQNTDPDAIIDTFA